jgi:tRNA pseudouridine55 synthase
MLKEVTQTADPSGIRREQLDLALASFCGLVEQMPPMYSAVKYQGRPLYKLARAGITVARKTRPTKIYHLSLIDWQPPVVTIEVICGKGTYIRSLAHDLGQTLGCGANLKSLIRLRCGLFDIKDAVSPPQLKDAFHSGYWKRLVYPIDIVLWQWTAVVVSEATGQAIRNGCPVVFENSVSGKPGRFPLALSSVENRCRVYTPDGCFLGVLRFNTEKGQWQPDKIFV